MKNKILLSLGLMLNFFAFGQNIVVNGDFNDGLNSWSTFVANWIPVSANFSADNNEANITGISGAGGETWFVQLNQELTAGQISSLVVGQTYEITFDARSSVNGRSLKLFFGEDGGGFAAVHQQDYTLTNANAPYSATFTVGATYGAMKLGFEMGLSNDPVYIDNVVLQPSSVVAPPTQPAGLVANTPTASSIFVACGPNQVGGNVVYRLFYAPTATAPANPQDATEYTFGSIAGDGNGVGPFGFNIPDLQSATQYTVWLYQYNTIDELFSTAATATETTLGGGGGGTAVPITFQVDMANFTGTFTTPEVNGTFNDWCGNCAAMTNTSGTIWSITIDLEPGTYEFKFSHDNWTGEEALAPGSACTVTTGEFTNRTLTVTDAATLPAVCWESCVACGVSTSRTVTFRVDMSEYAGTFTTPEVNGTFNNWCGNCAPLTSVGNGVWELPVTLEDGAYEFKFSYDNWAGQEALTPGSSCTVTEGEFTNRTLVVSQDTVLAVVCWNACEACDLVALEQDELSALTIYPNPSNGQINIQGTTVAEEVTVTITDAQGRIVYVSVSNGATMNEQINLVNMGAGIYFVRLASNNAQRVERIVVAD